MRYVSDHLNALPLAVMTRVLNTLDVPCSLASLMSVRPFDRRTRDGEDEKFFDGKWTPVPPGDRLRMTKTEGQVWLALYNLLMEPECRRK